MKGRQTYPWSHDCPRKLLMIPNALTPITDLTERYMNVTRFEGVLSQIASLILLTFTTTFEWCIQMLSKCYPQRLTHQHTERYQYKFQGTSFFSKKKRRAFAIRFPRISNQEGHGSESAPTGSHTLLPFPSYQHVSTIFTISHIYNRNM